jgi:serine protease Do
MRHALIAAGIFGLLAAARPARAVDEAALGKLDFRQVIQQSKQHVFPSVVYIKCVRQSHESGKRIAGEVSGSGVTISADGELLTNWHVVDKAVEVRCLMFDGRAFSAKVVGADKDLDVALLKMDMKADTKPVPFAALGDSSRLVEGDFVMAMGAPWGLNRSVSIGIISCTRRFLEDDSEYNLWLQTDASISPGNSGGPLVNTDGQVIGINSRGMTQGGDMGFAIPSSVIRQVLPRLRNGAVHWSYSGLRLQPLRDFNRNVYFRGDSGVVVASVDADSPAKKAGLREQDRLLSVDGVTLTGTTEEDLPDIRRTLSLLAVDRPAKFEVLREGKKLLLDVSPREKGNVEGAELDCPRWDLTVKSINQFDTPDLFFYRKEGVFIFGVKGPGNASDAGLINKDIVLEIDGQKVASLDDIRAIHKRTLDGVKTKNRILFKVMRGGLLRQVIVDLSKDYERE